EMFPALVELEQLGMHAALPGRENLADIPRSIGNYEIVREIGRGGMGVVYEAIDQPLSRRVALKVLPAHALDQPAHRARFELEARAAAALDHPNIVPVFAVGSHKNLNYYAMRLIPGYALDRVLAELRASRSTLTSE